MSYCRFSSGDIYLWQRYSGHICCQVCSLTPRTQKTIFTSGVKESALFPKGIKPCKMCSGEGCERCCMNHDTNLKTYEEAIDHVKAHLDAGHMVPSYVIPRIERDARAHRYTSSTLHRRRIAIRNRLKRMAGGRAKRKTFRRTIVNNKMEYIESTLDKMKAKIDVFRGKIERIRKNNEI